MRKRILTKWIVLTAVLVGLCTPLPAVAQSWFDSYYDYGYYDYDSYYYDSYEYGYYDYYGYYDSGWTYPLYLVSPLRWGISGCH